SVVDMPQAGQLGDRSRIRVHAVVVLQLASEFLLQHTSRIVDEALEAVSCCLVESHQSIPIVLCLLALNRALANPGQSERAGSRWRVAKRLRRSRPGRWPHGWCPRTGIC